MFVTLFALRVCSTLEFNLLFQSFNHKLKPIIIVTLAGMSRLHQIKTILKDAVYQPQL